MATAETSKAAIHADADKEARAARQDVRTRQILEAAAKLMQRSGSYRVSMQSIADEVGMSVGLIYRYYANKEALVKAVIVDVLNQMAYQVPLAIKHVEDPVRRVAAAFTSYAELIRDNRHAVLLTYRETYVLDQEGQDQVKALEMQTGQPMRKASEAAVEAGLFQDINARVFAYDLLIIAQAWALKYWYFSERMSFEEYVSTQLSLCLTSVLKPEHRETYADLFTGA